MKSLQDYIEVAQSEVLKNAGAFFAFGNEQFNEQRKEGVIYVNMGAGLVAPKNAAQTLKADLEACYEQGIQARKAEYSANDIIKYELGNHECQLAMNDAAARVALAGYGFTDAEYDTAWGEFWDYCIENDCF